MTVMLLIKHLRHIDECFESYCKFPLQIFLGFLPTFGLDLWFLAAVSFAFLLQYRFPTPHLSLAQRKVGCHSHSQHGDINPAWIVLTLPELHVELPTL